MADTIVHFPCAGCGKRLKGPANAAGRTVKCPTCGTAVVMPKAPSRAVAQEQSARASEQPHVAAPVTLDAAPASDRPPVADAEAFQKADGMKLIIRRDQKAHTGIFGGHKGIIFVLDCRVVLTPDEQQLIAKYKADHFLATPPRNETGQIIPGLKTNVECYTPSILMAGVHHECKDIAILLQTEDIIKQACRNFKTYLTVMATFGGEEVIEFE